MDNAHLYAEAQREIASRERIEATLRETDRRKDEFLAVLAHELRNPLAPIRQAAAISRAAGATDAQKRWSHDVISRQVQHMALLLDDLLDVSRITRGSLELRTQMTELSSIIDAAVETSRPILEGKDHSLAIEVPPAPVWLSADPLRIAQVLSNLLTNAGKYTDPHGEIRLQALVIGDRLRVSVADNGIGIPREALGEVFRMFSQVKTAQDRSDGGLGIGLALSRGLVELHGGTLSATSAGVGRGSEFVVDLPLLPQASLPAGAEAQAPRPAGTPRRVLIADDNVDAAETLAMCLRLEGHSVAVVNDGDAALREFAATLPDAVLLDIGMPGIDGYEVARRIRAQFPQSAVTLIAITGWGQDSDRAQALACGFNDHFTKPVAPERVLALLRDSTGTPGA
jgi:CheY-like chemotaxis protein